MHIDDYKNDYKNLIVLLVKKFLVKTWQGVEIGVYKGETSQHILKNSPDAKMLYGVDPHDREIIRNIATKTLKKYKNHTLLQTTSSKALTNIPDDLDFVFIDGDHSYQSVLADLKNYFPKLKSGGLLMGHDWTWKIARGGVVRAGNDFLCDHEKNLRLIYTNDELRKMELPFRVAGKCGKCQDHFLIHKSESAYPMWWRIKQ